MSDRERSQPLDHGFDLRAVLLAGMVVAPLYLGTMTWGFLTLEPGGHGLLHWVISLVGDVGGVLARGVGITAVIVSALLWRSREHEFSVRAFWSRLGAIVAILFLLYGPLVALVLTRTGWVEQGRTSYTLLALGVIVPLVTIFVGPWLYLKFRRAGLDARERSRFLFLAAIGLAAALPHFVDFVRLGIITLTSEGSFNPPTSFPIWALSWVSVVIDTFFAGFGPAFLFGVPALHYLKGAGREVRLGPSITAMICLGIAIWSLVYGLNLLDLTLVTGEAPTWDYWPTQEAAIALIAAVVGGLFAGVAYPFVIDRLTASANEG